MELEGKCKDTRHRFIQVQDARIDDTTSCLEYHRWHPALGCCFLEGLRCPPRKLSLQGLNWKN
jgi:hypothetical protein